jgi:uncharacterized membrane protein
MATESRNPAIAFLARFRGDILVGLGIALFVLLIGVQFDAWSGSLKGDDAYFHVGRVQFIIDNSPDLSWYHQSFGGYVPLRFEPPLLYFVVGAFHTATTLSIELLLQLGLYLSMVALGLSVYVLARFLSLPRLAAMGFALLIFTVPETWNWIVIGGAYLRIPALPLFFISIALVYRHAKQIDNASESFGTYIAVVATLALLAMTHPLIWQWAFLVVVVIYLLGVRAWSRKAYHLVRTLVPVAGLAAWLYVPLFSAYGSVGY